MDIQVGDRVTYNYYGTTIIEIIMDKKQSRSMLEELDNKGVKLLKIERPEYKVLEEKKELLTEEEKEFLKQYVKMSKLKITNIVKENENNQCKLVLYENGFGNCTYYKENYFKGLELNKKYTLSELGLED